MTGLGKEFVTRDTHKSEQTVFKTFTAFTSFQTSGLKFLSYFLEKLFFILNLEDTLKCMMRVLCCHVAVKSTLLEGEISFWHYSNLTCRPSFTEMDPFLSLSDSEKCEKRSEVVGEGSCSAISKEDY